MSIHANVPSSLSSDRAHEIADRIERRVLRLIRGAENAMTSGAIARLIGFPSSQTNQPIRHAMKILLVERGIPVVSGAKGFYVAVTPDELMAYDANLASRMSGIQRDRDAVNAIIASWPSGDLFGSEDIQ